MKEYHKIQTLFKRDMSSKSKKLIQEEWSLPEFEYLKYNTWVFTEKVDGTNIRIMYSNGGITFGGKTDNAQIPAKLITKLNDIFLPQITTFEIIFEKAEVCLYGEGYGEKIQNGGKYRADQSFVLFDVKIGEWWLQRHDIEEIASKLGLDIVPIVGDGTLYDAISIVQSGFKSQWGDFIAEGIVARPKIELKTRSGQRIITKIKYKDFELTGKENA